MIVGLPTPLPGLPQITHARITSIGHLTEPGVIRVEAEGGYLSDPEDLASYETIPAIRLHQYRIQGAEYDEATVEIEGPDRLGRVVDMAPLLRVLWRHVCAEYGIECETPQAPEGEEEEGSEPLVGDPDPGSGSEE